MSLATLRKNVCTDIDIGTALKEIAANPHIGDELALTCWMVVTSSALSLTSTIMQSALILWIASVTT